MQLVITYIASSDALVLGLSYFSGLVAFGASIGSTGNPAVVVGVVVGNAILGNGLIFSNTVIARCVVPLVAGSFGGVLLDFVGKKVPHFLEGLGSFYLALGVAGILKQVHPSPNPGPNPGPGPSPSPSPALTRTPISGCKAPWLRASRSSFAIGALLATWHAIGGGAGSYNPAVTLARFVKKDRAYSLCSSAVKTPALEILVQVVGAFVAAIASAWAMDADGFHTPATDAADLRGHLKPAVLDCLATAALALAYLANTSAVDTGLTYFGLLFSLSAVATSMFNPALAIAPYLAGIAGFGGGGGDLPLVTLIGGLAGAILAGSSDNPPKAYFPREAIGVFYVYLVVGTSSDGGIFGALAIGATTLAFTKIYHADLNPAVTFGASYNPAVSVARNLRNSSSTILQQIAGATCAAILGASWLNGFDGSVEATAAFSVKAAVAEALAAFLLVKVYPVLRSERDPQVLGLTYFAILAAFSSTMTSVANPALVAGRFLGNGLLPTFGDIGSGFDLSAGAMKPLLAHILAPLAGAVLCAAWNWGFLKIEMQFQKLLCQLKLSRDMVNPGELLGSFFVIVLLSAIGSGSPEALLASGIALMAVVTMVPSHDLLPSITVGRIFSGMTLKSSRSQVVELLLSICFQTLGAVLAIYFVTWLFGASTSASALTYTSMQDAAIRGFLLTLILSLGWKQGHLATGLSYFVAASMCSGSLDIALAINPAYMLGTCIHSLIAGSTVSVDALLLVVVLVPLIGGLAGGFLVKLVASL